MNALDVRAPRSTTRLRTLLISTVLALCLPAAAAARECAGVRFADSVQVAGTTLRLNGLGLREATVFDVDVFVAALYVQHASSDAATLLRRDEPTRVVLHFVRDTGAATIAEEMDAAYRANSPSVSVAKKRRLLVGQSIVFTYLPASGLEVRVAGKPKGTIEGAEFASATLGVLIGKQVADDELRAGLLGGRCE
jgi:Trk K+ transport system NAD-binding subunit